MCACEHGYANVVQRLLAVDGCDASIADHVSDLDGMLLAWALPLLQIGLVSRENSV